METKSIDALPEAVAVNSGDVFVAMQGTTAKKVPGSAILDFVNAAPDGFGLGGTYGKFLTDYNSADLRNGWYITSASTLNSPFVWMNYALVFVSRRYDKIIQFIQGFDGTPNNLYLECVRVYDGTKWSELEWVNPPMELGNEYRTTERWNGKAVYTKLVDLGTLPGRATNKLVSIGVTGVTSMLRVAATVSNGTAMPYTFNYNMQNIFISATAENVIVATGNTDYSDFSARTGIAQIWYVKLR